MSACMDRTNLLVRATSLWFMSKDSQRTAFPLATALCVVLAGLAVSEPVRADSFDGPLDASAQQAYEPTFSAEVSDLTGQERADFTDSMGDGLTFAEADCRLTDTTPGLINNLLGEACPRWVAQVDALMLWQGNISSRPLFLQYDSATAITGATALNVNQAQTIMAAGPRFGLFLNLDECYTIEGNYFQVRPFSGQSSLPTGSYAENNLAGLYDTGLTSAQVFTSGNIQSAELNWRRKTCGGLITWLGGFRWVEWNQQLNINEVFPTKPVSDLTVNTGNDLYGGQVGMDVALWDAGGRLRINGIGKSGVFYNTAYQRTIFQQSDIGAISAGAVADQTAFFGELGVNANVSLTKWLSWRAGYTLFWLSGVTVPADQLAVTNISLAPPVGSALINTNGSVMLHGVTTGLEARW